MFNLPDNPILRGNISSQFSIPDHAFDLDVYGFRIYAHLRASIAKGMPYRSARDIAEHCGIKLETARKSLTSLLLQGKVTSKQFTALEAALFCKQKPALSFFAGKRCDWCKSSSIVLEGHHYPIPRSEGGTKTVSICPGCHAEFHALTGHTYYTAAE